MAIDVKSQLSRLIYLQEHDLRLHGITEQIANIPIRSKEINVEVSAIKAEIETLMATKTANEVEKRDIEAQVADATEHLRRFESKLHAIKTNKEYQAAIKEIAEIKKFNKEKDDRDLQLMEAIEAATQKLTQLSSALADKELQVTSAVEALAKEAAECETDRQRCEEELRLAEAQVDPEVMRVYRMVRSRYVDALAPVDAGVCGGCRMKIQAQLHIEIQRTNRLCQCPSCHRILFAPEKTLPPV